MPATATVESPAATTAMKSSAAKSAPATRRAATEAGASAR